MIQKHYGWQSLYVYILNFNLNGQKFCVLKEGKMTLMLPPTWVLNVPLCFNWSIFICDPKMSITITRGVPMTISSFQRWTPWMSTKKPFNTYLPKGKPLGSHMIGWNHQVHPDTNTLIGWIVGGIVHQTASTRKVTHHSIIQALGGLTSKSF